MKLEVLKSPIYYYEGGVPAYKAGEWPGIKPNHFDRTRRCLKQIRKNENFAKIKSKKILHKNLSSEYVFRPCIKRVDSYFENIAKRNNNIRLGKRIFEQKSLLQSLMLDRKPFIPPMLNISCLRTKDNISTNNMKLPHIVFKKDISLSRNYGKTPFSFSELTLESTMNKKKKVISLDQRRNNYRGGNPGDKSYRYSECSPDFFKEGGLIVGSTNRIRITDNSNKLGNNIYLTMDLNKKILDTSKIWKNKILKEREKNESEYVSNLEKWEKLYVKEEEKKEVDKVKNKKINKVKNEKTKKKVKIKV